MSDYSEQEPYCTYCGEMGGQPGKQFRSQQGDLFRTYPCQRCGTIYLWPHPSAEVLTQAYCEDYYGSGEEKFTPLIEFARGFFQGIQANQVSKRVAPPGRVLDLGCGNGRALKSLLDRGYQCFGIELPGKSLERARTIAGLQLKQGALASGDYPDNYFDAVTLWHVFEHLDKPRETLAILSKVIRPGGWLLLSLPNIESWQAQWFGGDWFHLDPPRHLFFMGPDPLKQALATFGFQQRGQSFFSLEQNPFGFQQSLLNRYSKERDLLYEVLKGNTTLPARLSPVHLFLLKLYFLLSTPFSVGLSLLESLAGKGGTMAAYFQKID